MKTIFLRGYMVFKKGTLVGFLYVASRFFIRRIYRLLYSMVYTISHIKKISEKPFFLTYPKKEHAEKVTMIIPFRDKISILRNLLTSIFQKTRYPHYSIVLVDNQSTEKETKTYIEELKNDSRITIYNYNKSFNFADIHNEVIASGVVHTEYIILLNNDTEVISPDWIERMLDICKETAVGTVGALLWYPSGTVQHAGVSVGMFGMSPWHIYKGAKKESGLFNTYISKPREFHAITAACLMTKKSLWKKIGGMDGENFKVALNDVDYCLQLYELGYKNIYTPHAELYHYESYSRGYEFMHKESRERLKKEETFFLKKWQKYTNDTTFLSPIDYLRTIFKF